VRLVLFADKRMFLGITNTLDVLSNFIFLVVGLLALKDIYKNRAKFSKVIFYLANILAIAIIWTCFGSSYFHLDPNPQTLFWDRLPMTIGFASIVGLIIADRVDEKWGTYFCEALILFGLYSIIGYRQGWLTLRPYIALQFGSIAFIAIIISVLKPKLISNKSLWTTIALYIVAKILELSDRIVLDSIHLISGHSLKHIFAGFAVYAILREFKNPKPQL
jgi:hypothetical protein